MSLPERVQLILDGIDVSQLIGSLSWSGDVRQSARRLQFTLLANPKDYYLPSISYDFGSAVVLHIDGVTIFDGLLMMPAKRARSGLLNLTALDYGHYLSGKYVLGLYAGSAGAISRQIMQQYGFPVGDVADGGLPAELLSQMQYTIWQCVQNVYEQSGLKVWLEMVGQTANLRLYDTTPTARIDGQINLIDSSVSGDASSAVTQVAIIAKEKQAAWLVDSVTDAAWQAKIGTMEVVYTTQKDVDPYSAARAKLKAPTVRSSLEALGDIRVRAGRMVTLVDPETAEELNLVVIADRHSLAAGRYTMSLDVEVQL